MKKNNIVFDEIKIMKLAEKYGMKRCVVDTYNKTIRISSEGKFGKTQEWFVEVYDDYILLSYNNHSKKIHSHDQRVFYKLDNMFDSIESHIERHKSLRRINRANRKLKLINSKYIVN